MNTTSTDVQKKRNRFIVIAGSKTREMLSLTLLLQRFEYEVSTADTAAQALERISAKRPALIITELVLPGMKGMELFQLLRQDLRTAFIPVIFVVPVSDAAAERRCLGMGAAGCITKPIQAEELYRTVQKAIEPRPRTDIRIETRLPVSVNDVPLDCPEGQCGIDLSEHGMYVPMDKPLPHNRRITVQFHIKDRTISVQGAVLHSHTTSAGPHQEPGIGLKFLTIASQDQQFIRAFIRDEVMRDIKAALSSGESAVPW